MERVESLVDIVVIGQPEEGVQHCKAIGDLLEDDGKKFFVNKFCKQILVNKFCKQFICNQMKYYHSGLKSEIIICLIRALRQMHSGLKI